MFITHIKRNLRTQYVVSNIQEEKNSMSFSQKNEKSIVDVLLFSDDASS